MWAEVVEADTPNAAEMAEAEAGLRELGDVEPMAGEDVEALVARATKGPGVVVSGGGVVGEVVGARRFRQPMIKAAAGVLLLMAVAWAGRHLVWQEQQRSDFTLDYAEAVLLATEPGRTDSAYLNALSQIVADCGAAAEKLRQLATQVAHPTLANQARQISDELVALITNGPNTPSGVVDLRLPESLTTALDESQPLDVRHQALTHVGELARGGLTAMLLSPLVSDDAKMNRSNWIARLKRTLSR